MKLFHIQRPSKRRGRVNYDNVFAVHLTLEPYFWTMPWKSEYYRFGGIGPLCGFWKSLWYLLALDFEECSELCLGPLWIRKVRAWIPERGMKPVPAPDVPSHPSVPGSALDKWTEWYRKDYERRLKASEETARKAAWTFRHPETPTCRSDRKMVGHLSRL